MKCPFCQHIEDKVIDSRPVDEGAAIRRRRECLSCGHRFTTYEKIERLPLMVIKKDGSRQPFDREKLINGILKVVKSVLSRQLKLSMLLMGSKLRPAMLCDVKSRRVKSAKR